MKLPVIVPTALLLAASNVFMTFAWYGHLKNMNTKPWYFAAFARTHPTPHPRLATSGCVAPHGLRPAFVPARASEGWCGFATAFVRSSHA